MSMDVRSTVLTIVSVTVGILLVSSLLLPELSVALEGLTPEEESEYGPLLKLTAIITIIGIIVAALYMYTSSK